jgi:SAM-dependent methyltransferase
MSSSPFVVEQLRAYATGSAAGTERRMRALDVAMGRGRHTLLLARAGFRTFGVDANLSALRDAAAAAAAQSLHVHLWCADLRQHPLPRDWFDLIVVCRYLQRDLFEPLRAAAAAGGIVLYETFTTAQRAHGVGPRSPDHLLEPGELRSRFDVAGWAVLFYEETREPEAVARIVAQRLQSPA